MFELRGNLHVHSCRSDGSMSLEDIARCARGANLDFVGINDHHVECEQHHYRNQVLFLMGSEYNRTHSHYLAYNVESGPGRGQFTGRELVELVNRQRGMGIIAHPFEKGSPYFSWGRAYRWLDWGVSNYQGIELWNATSHWKGVTARLLRALWLLLVDPYRPFLDGPCRKAMARWDKETERRHVTGIAGSDLHAPALRFGSLRIAILDYPMLFRALNNYVLVENRCSGCGSVDGNAVIAALKRGRCWFALDRLGIARGFRFWAHNQRRVGMGETLAVRDGVTLEARAPESALFRFLLSGRQVAQERGKNVRWQTTVPGTYRVEVWKQLRRREVPWIIANPIYLS